MCKWIATLCVFLGVVCILSSIGFVVYNHYEDENAARVSESLLQELKSAISKENVNSDSFQDSMHTIKVDGYDCIGVLSIPVLDLELPVLSNWSYTNLKKAPCCYYGSYNEKDFVVAAHNYKSHFGRLSELQEGDVVTFTDVNGITHYYEVVLLETLPKNATNEMITSGFDFSLYTCTLGGGSRITVRCNIK